MRDVAIRNSFPKLDNLDFMDMLLLIYFILLPTLVGIIMPPRIKKYFEKKLKQIKEENELLLEFQRSNPTKILYLRDFATDGLQFKVAKGTFKNFEYIESNFETKLSGIVGRLGHFVAVGIPSPLDDIGADRLITEDKNWKEELARQMEESAMIIFRPSLSVGVVWEFEQILKRSYHHKTVMCYNKKEDGRNNYKLFRQVTNQIVKLPSPIFASKYMCLDEKNRIHKYHRLQRTPIYKELFAKEKDHFKQFELPEKRKSNS